MHSVKGRTGTENKINPQFSIHLLLSHNREFLFVYLKNSFRRTEAVNAVHTSDVNVLALDHHCVFSANLSGTCCVKGSTESLAERDLMLMDLASLSSSSTVLSLQ